MPENVLASSLSGSPLEKFDQIWASRLEAIDIGVALVCIIDTLPAEALPWLAQELNVTGLKGWDFCTTDLERRELLKNAIELHRYKGTPFGIIRAVQSIGFAGAEIQERAGILYDGSTSYGGSITHGSNNWATFRVRFDLGNQKGITTELGEALKFLIKEYKPASRTLVGIDFTASLTTEAPDPVDTLEVTGDIGTFADRMTVNGITYDGSATYGGADRHNGGGEKLELTGGMEFVETLPSRPLVHEGLFRFDGGRKYDATGTVPPGDAGLVMTIIAPNGETQTLTA